MALAWVVAWLKVLSNNSKRKSAGAPPLAHAAHAAQGLSRAPKRYRLLPKISYSRWRFLLAPQAAGVRNMLISPFTVDAQAGT